MIDPRVSVIEKRLSSIKEIVAISGGKGGVGKSTIACLLSLYLSEKEKKVGLLDLDFYGPSTHIILGVDGIKIEEEMGILPPKWMGIYYMSSFLFTKGKPLPARGKDISNLIKEILSVTIWKEMDFLVLDMPPGIGETLLDVLRFIKRTKFLLIRSPSRLAEEVLKRELTVLRENGISVIGILENAKTGLNVENEVGEVEAPFLGSLSYDSDFEKAIGSPERIRDSSLYKEAKKIFEKLFF